MRLDGKIAIVTGGGSGIGQATALLFAKEGAKVCVADYQEDGRVTAEQIVAQGGDATFVVADVRRAADVEAMVEHAVGAYGGLNILHNNAGVFPREGAAHELDEDLWDRILATNLKGVWLGCKYAIPELIKAGGGAIVNTASLAGIRGRAYHVAYCSSKGGVIMLTKALSVELAPHNIRVNCVCPGAVNTPLIRPAKMTADDLAAETTLNQPITRISSPQEQAAAVLYLASDEASYVTGQSLLVDGGAWAGTTEGLRRQQTGH